jgi:glycerol-3-phosphate dehydrogenase (NAD(P)+)
MQGKVAALGAGSWGTTVAGLASRKAPTVLWAREDGLAEEINDKHTNTMFLPDMTLPGELRASQSIEETLADATAVIVGVPSPYYRAVLGDASRFFPPGVPILNLTKGLEVGSLRRMTEILAELLPDSPAGVLSGPNLAKEIASGGPAATVVAFADQDLAQQFQQLLGSSTFRVYTNPDVIGCELGGVLKNVIAIATGLADGLELGDNSRAALVTRGLAEVTRLGVALGGEPLTFLGLAGVGDLVVTCMSPKSRNHSVGVQLGQGRTLDEIIAEMNMIAEGVKSSLAVVELAGRVGVEVPIASQVVEVLHHGRSPLDALSTLMEREMKSELNGMPPSAGH